ncbi:MAG: hypothetical protein RLZZ584_3519 [Pseudomonadota bacterium]|jgi:hypothetical protein
MTHGKLTPLALALAAALVAPAQAQTSSELGKELQALKDRIAELEKKLAEQQQAGAATRPAGAQWGMTPEQVGEFNRIAVKTEAMEDARDASGLKLLKFSGYMDPTWVYNRNQGRSGAQFLSRAEDDGYNYDNSYFGSVSLDFQKETDSGTKWRLTLVPNRGVGTVFNGNSVVHEASVSIPLTDLQTRFIAGQIPDWSGYEYLQPTLNKLITHNLLFDFTLPTAYTGAGMEITSGKWIVKGVVGNMNTAMKPAGHKSPVVAYRVDYSRGEFQGFGFAGVHGKAANFRADETDETTDDPIYPNDIGKETTAHLFEFDAYFIRGDVTVQGQLSAGMQKKAAITPSAAGRLRTARWAGLSGLFGYKLDPRMEAVLRYDMIFNKKNGGGLLGYTSADDRNGIGPDANGDPDIGANRSALSFGLSYLLNLNTTLKAEYRLDRASQPVFVNTADGSLRRNNSLLATSVVVSF